LLLVPGVGKGPWLSYLVIELFGVVIVGVTTFLVAGSFPNWGLGYDRHTILASFFVISLCVFAITTWQFVPVWRYTDYRKLITIYATFWVVWACLIPMMIVPTIIAALLHLGIVFYIGTIDRKHAIRPLDTAISWTPSNLMLVLFSGMFLALTIMGNVKGDYWCYGQEWLAILEGRDPWAPTFPLNAYGPLFNVLAPLFWIASLAPKLLFAFAYVFYVIWLIKDFGAARGVVALSWPAVVFWLVNPYPWVEIAYCGHLDVLVALACVAAVHSQEQGKKVLSAFWLAIGILIKYLPIVILPFFVFNERRLRLRTFSSCAVLVALGLTMSTLVWGHSTFSPLTYAATRDSNNSIYELLGSVWASPHLDSLEKPLGLAAGLAVLTWCVMQRLGFALSAVLAILVTLLFYRVGSINYQMVLFFLVSYWAVSNWQQLKEYSVLSAVLISYFGLLAATDIAIFFGWERYGDYSMAVVLLKFLVGCALLGGLLHFSAGKRLQFSNAR
jgi:hypothetical protein